MKLLRLHAAAVFCATAMSASAAPDADSSFVKTGFSFGVLPAVAYDADLGFQYGVLSNLYWYGDGSRYPAYDHSLYVELSRYIAGTMMFRAYYDSPTLLARLSPTLRLTVDYTMIRDLKSDFYGFNGRKSVYREQWEDEDGQGYISTAFFAHHRRMIRGMAGIRHNIPGTPLFAQFGVTAFDVECGPVRRSEWRHTPPDAPTLYDLYRQWGVIRPDEAEGGTDVFLRLGFGYDSRDNEAFATQGVWSEILFAAEPKAFTSNKKGFLRLTLNHRQYFSLGSPNLVLAYRLTAQNRLSGRVPFYILPHLTTNTLTSATSQGLGGGKTLRGVLRNRIVADGVAMANVEARWLFARFNLLGQQWALGVNAFGDMGIATQEYDCDTSGVPDDLRATYFRTGSDNLHGSLGAGLKIHMNANFIVSADYGRALRADDGEGGFYVYMNYLF